MKIKYYLVARSNRKGLTNSS